MARILVIEDEPTIGMVLQLALTDLGHKVHLATDCTTASEYMRGGGRPDLAIVDLFLKGENSSYLITKARERGYTTPVIVITGAAHITEALPPAESYQALFSKPFELDELIETVTTLLKKE